MPAKVHVKQGDNVLVLTGKDRGKTGKVLTVIPDDFRVIVEGVNVRTKHKKAKGRYQQGGIIHQESTISSSNVMVMCAKCGKPTKVGKTMLENGDKARVCKKCNEIIDVVRGAKNA